MEVHFHNAFQKKEHVYSHCNHSQFPHMAQVLDAQFQCLKRKKICIIYANMANTEK